VVSRYRIRTRDRIDVADPDFATRAEAEAYMNTYCLTSGVLAVDECEVYDSTRADDVEVDARELIDRIAALEAQLSEARHDLRTCEEARACVVCGGMICPPMTCTGCQLHRGDATAISDHALREECNRLRALLDAAAEEPTP
jgi:hypothetical protein